MHAPQVASGVIGEASCHGDEAGETRLTGLAEISTA